MRPPPLSMIRKSILALAIASSVGILAVAQQRGSSLEAKFHQLDKDGDGKLVPSELPEGYLAKLDLDKDGIVTLDEARKAVGMGAMASTDDATPMAARLFETADKNGDGKVTREEAGNARWFDRLDRNKDGSLERDEVIGVAKQIKEYVDKNRGASDLPKPDAEPLAEPLTAGPRVLKGGDLGVGRQVSDLVVTDLVGKTHKLSELAKKNGLVIACTSATCPVSKRYAPSLQRLEKELAAQGIGMLVVNPFASESMEEMKAQGFASTYAHDRDKSVVTALDARSTTEVFLLDASRTLLYRGAMDDQYGVAYNRDAPVQRFLYDAIANHLDHRLPHIAATEAPGCELDHPSPAAAATTVTYYRDVARILQQNCVECHRDQGIAPFGLDDVAEVTDRAKTIKRVVTQGTMPPWFAAPQGEGKPSPWANDCSLSERDKSDLLAWIDSSDRPLGDPKDAPQALKHDGEWTMGTPDYVVQIPRPMKIKAEGTMPYQFEIAETTLTEDKWVQGYEIVPTERSVVHHVIVNVHLKGKGIRDRDEGDQGYWAAYVPGNSRQVYPPGFARKLPAGSRISFQIHYTPSGKEVMEQLKMGLIFAKESPKYVVQTIGFPHHRLNIPPQEANHMETASRVLPKDLNVMALMAHMHVRGKAFRFDLTSADGKTETLLDIPRYDFNWQIRYDYAAPKFIPRGSKLTITAVFDNSAANKANPDPSKTVRWGQQTYDEMMIGYVEVFSPLKDAETVSR